MSPAFVADGEVAADVARLVRLLDGLPLAIELAAARGRVLPPRRILERIGRRFELLKQRRGVGPERQTTLRGAIDWSWELLSREERAALAQCSSFEGASTWRRSRRVDGRPPRPALRALGRAAHARGVVRARRAARALGDTALEAEALARARLAEATEIAARLGVREGAELAARVDALARAVAGATG